ncbi:MAG: AbrB/MazE/SpoVT family DNA-binding domain-containing protein, partial [Candidatus Lokiarchaeota archaeon]|nr:AbrB/MazE/SpoVT family DNA-binding domain-containing protein [Candidatus Lokiarchaeota archaeon]
TTVGKRGEILPKKALRKIAGFRPGDRVLVEARENQIVINKILSVDEALAMSVIAKGTPAQLEAELDAEGSRHEDGGD